MKLTKIRYRILAGILGLSLLGNSVTVCAMANTNVISQDDIAITDAIIEDAIIEDTTIEDAIIEDTTIEDTTIEDTTIEDTTTEDISIEDIIIEDTIIEDTAIENVMSEEQELLETEESDSIKEAEASAVSENDSDEATDTTMSDDTQVEIDKYTVTYTVSDITCNSADVVVNVGGLQDGEKIYLQITRQCNKEVTKYFDAVWDTYVTSAQPYVKLSGTYLYADAEYCIRTTVYADENYTMCYGTEEISFQTLSNPIDLEGEVTISDVLSDKVTVNVALSEVAKEEYQTNSTLLEYVDTVGMAITVCYQAEGDSYQKTMMRLYQSEDGTIKGSTTLSNLYSGTKYSVEIIWPDTNTCGKEVSSHKVTTLGSKPGSEIAYTFSMEGDTIESRYIQFALVSGYEENAEYEVKISEVDSEGNIISNFANEILNSKNNYTYQSSSETPFSRKWGQEQNFQALVRKKLEDGNYMYLFTAALCKKAESPMFELSVNAESITYITAKIDVNWVNKEVIGEDKIQIYLQSDDYLFNTNPVTLIKGQKEQAIVAFYELHPGKTYEMLVKSTIGNIEYEFERISFTTREYAFEPFSEVKFPTQMDIAGKWNELGININEADTYERNVNHTDGGLLSKSTLQNAVDLTNFIRYVAGLPSDLIYDEEWCSMCNAGCELNRLNKQMSHYPEKPDEVSEEYYQRGRKATSSSNIAFGYINLANSILGYMADHGESNISKGHRTWILDPALSTLGFGKSQGYYSMYVFSASDYNSARETNFNKGYYYWPAANMPMEIYTTTDTAYTPSVHLSSEYDYMVADDITVHVESKKLGKEWTFTGDTGTYSSNCYMRVYGHKIVFSTGLFPKGDEVTVTVTGTTINGQPAPITYTMNFFSIADIDVPDIPAEGVSIADNPLEVMEGESVQFRAKFTPENTTNKKVSWSVESADGIGQADITPEGILTGKIEGTVKVTATSESDSTLSDSVLVKITEWQLPLKSIRFTKDTLQLEKGSTYYLPVVLTPTNATDNEITYESLAPEKVSIVNGVIQAIEVTEEPVVVRAVAGELYAECLVEVLEGEEERPDKNYDTRITDVLMTGESEVFVGETNLIKCYPVTNGQELLASEYAITINYDKKYLNLTSVTSEDNGCWYCVTGTKVGKQKISITMTSKVKGNKTPESVTKNILYVVAEKASEEPQEIAAAPVLVNSNIIVNQNTIDGTPLDIRLIEGNTNITKVSLTSKKNDGTEKAFNVTLKDGTYYIQTKQIGANKKYNLICHIKTDQGTWEYPLNVTTKTSFPSVSIKQTIKPNVLLLNENAVYQITGKETIESIAFQTSSSDFKQKSIEGTDKAYVLTIGQLKHGTKLDKKGTIEIAFAGYRTSYSKKVTIATVSKKIKSNTLISDVKKITLNSIECGEIPAMVKMRLQNSTEAYPAKMLVSSTNDKTAAMLTEDNLQFVYNKKTGLLKVFIKKGTEKGNYKFKLTGYVSDKGTYVKAEGTVSLTVVVATAKPTLTLKPAGNIDLIAREQTCVTYTPSMKDFAGRVVVASLEGKDAAKFYASVDDNGKIKVYAKPYAAVLPKTTYELSVKATLENGYVCEPVTVRIKPKQSAFRAVAKQSTITLCRNEVSAYPVAMIVKSPVSSKIAYVKAVSIPQGMQYDSANKTLKITDSTKLKAGKTYKVTFEVTPVGAHRSIKPAKVTMKVKVQ